MNPLAAIRQLMSSDPQAASKVDAAANAGMIPTQELKTLGTNSITDTAPTLGNSTGAIGFGSGNQFGNLLSNLVSEVNEKKAVSNQATAGLLEGKNVSLHQAVIAMEEASISFQLMVEVRNKLLDSYQELMRMQV